ncbi:MAG: alpha/beta hydrolase family protein [Thermomicrobiales bacterium]
MGHRDAEWMIDVAGIPTPVLLRTPTTLAERPALLIHLTLAMGAGLDELPHGLVPRAFLAAGYRVASFDLPHHGRLVDQHGTGLVGMAAAMAAGSDVVARAIATGRGLTDAYLARANGEGGAIVLCGISRGGFFALHLLAADPRIAAAASFAPVTNLLALREFTGLAQCPLVQQANAIHLVPQLAGRPTFCAINDDDRRVSTADCLAFHAALRAASPDPSSPALRVEPGDTHTVSDDAYHEGAAWLLDRIG